MFRERLVQRSDKLGMRQKKDDTDEDEDFDLRPNRLAIVDEENDDS